MKKVLKKLKKSNKFARVTYYILNIAYLVSFFFFVKSLIHLKGIETVLRVVIIIFFIIYFILYFLWNLVNLIKRKYKVFTVTSIISLIFVILFSFGAYYIDMVYDELGNISESEKVEYTSYLITLKDTEFTNESTIGRIDNKDDVAGYQLAEKLYVKENLENTIVDYDDYVYMINEMYKGNVDAVFVPSNYVILYNTEEGLENIAGDTKILYEYSELMDNTDSLIVSDKDFSEPLTFLIMGVDSEKDGLNANAAFNGDTLMLVSFNPETLKITMVSIPRDTYVPIACRGNAYSKINSAAGSGTSCVIDTVSNFLDVDIDYYAKINFKGVVELVDAVGGIEVDVQAPDFSHHHVLGIDCGGRFCEQNSNRGTGSSDIIYLDPGVQTLNGEQALAYSRSRYIYAGSDLDRIKHQQQVVEALASKVLSFDSISDFQKILTAVSNNMVTNMERSKILSGYNVIKKMLNNALNGDDLLNINKAYLETYGLYVYVPTSRAYTSAQGYYIDSLEAIQKALKETLGIEEEEVIKTFSFSVNEEYITESPGRGLKSTPSSGLLANFVGKTVTEAENYCNENGITLSVKYVDPGSEYYNSSVAVGLIGSQSIHEKVLLSTVNELTVYVVNSVQENSDLDSDGDSNKNNNSNDSNDEDSNKEEKNDKSKTEDNSEEEIKSEIEEPILDSIITENSKES